ncbi:MAG TPA: hypothetical protein VJJ21_02385 [Candidatus Nanoarchaeia archaeon]|nr:hypothetical protein [Candidatus Nanoarchaeia archaeon]
MKLKLFKGEKEEPVEEAKPQGPGAYMIGQTIYTALCEAAEENPHGIQVRNSRIQGSSQYRIDVGFTQGILSGRISDFPAEQGELYCQVFIDTLEKGAEIKVAYGNTHHPSLTPLYERDPQPRYDKIEGFQGNTFKSVAETLANKIRTAERKIPDLTDLMGEQSWN